MCNPNWDPRGGSCVMLPYLPSRSRPFYTLSVCQDYAKMMGHAALQPDGRVLGLHGAWYECDSMSVPQWKPAR